MPEEQKKQSKKTESPSKPTDRIDHNVIGGTELTISVRLIDSENPRLWAVKTINLFDVSSQEEVENRLESHKRSFLHRINIGVIQEQDEPVDENPENPENPEEEIEEE